MRFLPGAARLSRIATREVRNRLLRFQLIVTLLLSGCGPSSEDLERELASIFETTWEFRLKEDPLLATSVGRHEYNHRLPEISRSALQRQADFFVQTLNRLNEIDLALLSPQSRINSDIFRIQIEDWLADYGFKGYLIPILADSGFHISLARLPERVPLNTTDDYRNYIARLGGIGLYMGGYTARMREGLRSGFTQPRVILEGYEGGIQAHVPDKAENSVFYAPFKEFPPAVAQADQETLAQLGKMAVSDVVIPSYARFLRFMLEEYRPQARTTLGASDLPNGADYYAYLVRHFTTLDVSPEKIHQTGLDEVARIRAEMEEVIRGVGFEGTFSDFLTFLRTDPRFYADSARELLKEASFIAKKMDGKLPGLFRTLPRLPYSVAPVPESIAPKYTAGRYVGAPVGSTLPGYYWVNTYNLSSRPLYVLEALTLHEAVPGHHLQNALRQEIKGLPQFRRFAGFNAFGEGWGLYAERLGLEAGFYSDPYSNFGRLTYEMWRACRLVVDTGLHARGWTREQAIDYLASNTALSLHEVRTEADRYISWPGQALAYKMGALKIRELRHRAETALGPRFDIRDFHDAVLLNGSIPISVLEEQINTFIQSQLEPSDRPE